MQMVEGDDVEMTSTENLFHTVMLTLEMSDGVCLDVAEERLGSLADESLLKYAKSKLC